MAMTRNTAIIQYNPLATLHSLLLYTEIQSRSSTADVVFAPSSYSYASRRDRTRRAGARYSDSRGGRPSARPRERPSGLHRPVHSAAGRANAWPEFRQPFGKSKTDHRG